MCAEVGVVVQRARQRVGTADGGVDAPEAGDDGGGGGDGSGDDEDDDGDGDSDDDGDDDVRARLRSLTSDVCSCTHPLEFVYFS